MPAIPSAFLAVGLPPKRGVAGLPRSTRTTTNDLAPACAPAALMSVCLLATNKQPGCIPFGQSLSAPLAHCSSRCLEQFTSVGHVVQSGSSDRLDAGSLGSFLTVASSPGRAEQLLVRQLLTRSLPTAPVSLDSCGRSRRFAHPDSWQTIVRVTSCRKQPKLRKFYIGVDFAPALRLIKFFF